MVLVREALEELLIVGDSTARWVSGYGDREDLSTTFIKPDLTTTWDYRKSGWRINEETIIDKVLNKYQNGD